MHDCWGQGCKTKHPRAVMLHWLQGKVQQGCPKGRIGGWPPSNDSPCRSAAGEAFLRCVNGRYCTEAYWHSAGLQVHLMLCLLHVCHRCTCMSSSEVLSAIKYGHIHDGRPQAFPLDDVSAHPVEPTASTTCLIGCWGAKAFSST